MSAATDHACALFGLDPRAARSSTDLARRARHAARRLDINLLPGETSLVTGPSGSGKSTILHALEHRLDNRAIIVSRPPTNKRCSVVDLFPGPVEERLRTLARAGLADATIFARRPGQLSEGQSARLALALAMAKAARRPTPVTVIADEFASTLDRTTALCVARTLSRWVRTLASVRAVCATAHDDLLESIAPAVLVHVPIGTGVIIERTRTDHRTNAAADTIQDDAVARTRPGSRPHTTERNHP